MLDPKLLRGDHLELDQLAKKLKHRQFKLDVNQVSSWAVQRRELQTQVERLKSEKNSRSKAIGHAKAKGEDIHLLHDGLDQLNDEIKEIDFKLGELQKAIENYSLTIPNLHDESVPIGKTADDNHKKRSEGTLPQFEFTPKDHVQLGKKLAGIDFELSAKITGSRFVVLNGPIARLHRALTQWMLDTHIQDHGYTEVYVPYIVNAQSLQGTGQLPKFADDLFKIGFEKKDYYLTPTAEVPITNLIYDTILQDQDLPRKWVAHTPCFRSEAGSYGQDTLGLIRQHQFEKVELVQVVRPQDSKKALDELTAHAEEILKKLKLPYQVMMLCSGDMGFAAAKTYDLEVWLPGQQKYREISSCSNFTDFQARRMKARWKNPKTNKNELLHTLNGSGLAVGRTLVAVMENYQNADGSITVPEILVKYMGGIENIPDRLLDQ